MQSCLTFLAACGVVGMLVHDVSAQVPFYGSSPNRVAHSDAVFVGRVVAFEPKDIEAAPAKGQPKVTFRIAVVQVNETVRGLKKDVKTVRVGFPVGNTKPGADVQIPPDFKPGGGLGPLIIANPIVLQVDLHGLFFLTRHFEESFFVSPPPPNFVNLRNNTNFGTEVKSARQVSKVIDNPIAALKSQDKDERYAAAAVLVSKYRSYPTGLPMKQEAISAEESKLILKAMAEGDWATGRLNATLPNPHQLFNQLGISVNDGYKAVNGPNEQEITQAMQKWISDNSDTYLIKKLVDPNAKAVQPNPAP